MNPITRLSVDPLPEPRSEPRASGAAGDADPSGFGMALAMAAAAQPQAPVPPPAAPVADPAPVPDGDGGGSGYTAAARMPAKDAMGARPGGMPLPASPAGTETKAAAPLPLAPGALPPGDATPEPARPEPARARGTPADRSGQADAAATRAAAEAAPAARDASPRTADLPLNFRVLELVRGMTEQAARVALDTAASAGPAQAGAVPADAEQGRGRSGEGPPHGDGGARTAAAVLAETAAAARAPVVDEAVPVSPGPGPAAVPGARPGPAPAAPAAGAAWASAPAAEAPAAPRFGDQVTLHFSGEDGLEGRLRVAVRGQSVRATILSDDAGAAERFSRGLGELQRALHERGFSEARLNVQHTARSESPASGNAPREDARGDSDPRDEGRDRHPSSRQERESASTEEHPRRRPSRPRSER